ncbi:hypothetical protein RM572_29245, partial [Streptomyces sp. DSM 42041]|nr:hypothetical protein [Streptomyces sp. DSM 42041]
MGETQDKVLIFSADGHAGAKRMADYLPYFDPDVRDAVKDLLTEEEQAYRRMLAPDFSSGPREEPAPELDPRWAPAFPDRFGGWDIGVRMEQLDREGVAGEMLVPGHQFASLP